MNAGTSRPGPGQAPDNFVNTMACGHELDHPEELPAGRLVGALRAWWQQRKGRVTWRMLIRSGPPWTDN